MLDHHAWSGLAVILAFAAGTIFGTSEIRPRSLLIPVCAGIACAILVLLP